MNDTREAARAHAKKVKEGPKSPRAETPLARANRLHFDGTVEAYLEAIVALTQRELSRHVAYVKRIDEAEE